MTQSELQLFLLNSRKSFRNLFIYIERIKDTIRYIDSILLGHNFRTGHTQFSNIAKDNSGARLDNWAWDWLPMYAYEFHFGVNPNNNISFSIFIIADTGFYDLEQKDALAVDEFGAVEESKSKVVFCIGKNDWFNDKSEYSDFEKLFSKHEVEYDRIRLEEAKYLYAYSYDLESFIDLEGIRSNLEDFITRCKSLNLETIEIN